MNEKIRELMVNSGFATGYDRTQTGRWILSDKELEKFAELIVAECIKAVDNSGGDNAEYHMDSIKKHFGEEE